jgi:hypothetical protein
MNETKGLHNYTFTFQKLLNLNILNSTNKFTLHK